MSETRRSYEEFTGKLREVVQKMAEDGIPQAQIGAFIQKQKAQWGEQENASRATRMTAAEDEGSIGSAVGRGVSEWAGNWKDRLVAMARGAGKLGSMAASPVESYRNLRDVPEARRELGRGLSDTLAGVPAWLGDKAGVTGYAQTAEHDSSVADDPRVKDMRGAGAVAGTVAMLPAGGLTKNLVTRAPVNASLGFKAAAAAPIMAGAYGAVHGALDPQEHVLPRQNPDGTIDPGSLVAAATDPTVHAVPLAVNGAVGVSKLLRRNKTIGQYARAKDAGEYQKPAMRELPGGQEGMQKAAEKGLGRIVKRDQQLGEAASQRYDAETGPHLDRPVSPETIGTRLLQGMEQNIDPDSGLPIRPEVQAAYTRAFDNTPESPTVRGTLMRRRGLQQDASFGNPSPSAAQEAARDVYQTFRQAVREASPEVAAADDAYSAHARQAQRRADILFNTEENVIPSGGGSGAPDARPVDMADMGPQGAAAQLSGASPQMRVGKERSAATTVSRINDDNVPGLRAARYLEELAAQDPEFAAALKFIADKKAFEGTRFGLSNQLPTSLSEATSLAGKLPFAQQNMRALGAQVVDPAADLVGRKVGPGSLAINPVVQAYAAQQERNRRMAETLKRGGR